MTGPKRVLSRPAALEQLQIVVDAISAPVARCSRDLRYVWVSKHYAEWVRRPVDEIIGQPIASVIGDEALAAIQPYIDRVMRGERCEYEQRVLIQGLGPRWLHAVYTPTFDGDGVADGWVAVVMDVDERHRAEELLRRSQTELQHLAAIITSSDDAIVSKDLDGIITSWNRAAERMFGYSADEAVGRSIRLIIPEDRQQEEDYVLAQIRAGEVVEHFETIRRRKDGTLFPISVTVSPIRAFDGRVIGASKIARDISERKRLDEQLETANRLKDDFLATLSHELRTPLNAVLGYTRMLRAGMLPPDRAEQALEVLDRNATSLTRIVEDVLDVSRIVSGKTRLQVEAVDLRRVIRDAIDTIAPAADARGVRVEPVLDATAAPIFGDPDRLQQVVWNLLSNAVKFTPRGGHVRVSLEVFDPHVEIAVSDTGIGIPADFLPHIFERFRQAEAGTKRLHGGLGLGLAIARHLVEMHGGSIEAASEGENRGATFRINLPRLLQSTTPTAEARRAPPRAEPSPAAPLGQNLRDLHVLAVDDDPDALGLLRQILEAAGARVTAAATAEDALRSVEQQQPDVLIADIGMPVMDGFDLISALRASSNPGIRSIPAAALTAFARSDDRARALRCGFEEHVAKPIDPAEIVSTVAALARRRRPADGR